MIRKVLVPPRLQTFIQHMHPRLKAKVRVALSQLLTDPTIGKALKEELLGLWSYPIGKWRIIYCPRQQVIEIIALGPRKNIYQETYRMVKKELKHSS